MAQGNYGRSSLSTEIFYYFIVYIMFFFQGKYQSIKRNHEKLEMEMMQVRLWQAETVDGEFDEDDVDGKVSIYSIMIEIKLLLLLYICENYEEQEI